MDRSCLAAGGGADDRGGPGGAAVGGADSYGVLAHVAAADPAMMGCTRRIYDEAMMAKDLAPNTAQSVLRLVTSSYGFEVAALLQGAAPQWAATVREAWQASRREIDRALSNQGKPAGVCAWRPEDPAQHAREVVKSHALWACSLWSREPLLITAIEAMARVVSNTALCSLRVGA